MKVRGIMLAVVTLSLCALTSRAGSITYDFVENGSGTIGGILVFNSPPASPDSFWLLSSNSDIVSFQVTDPSIAPAGFYTPSLAANVVSFDGLTLRGGEIRGVGAIVILTAMNDGATTSTLGPEGQANGTATGTWQLASVPEPSSLALAGIAVATGFGVWLRRRASQ